MLNEYKEKVMEEGEQDCGRYFDRFDMHIMEGAYGSSFPATKEELLKYIKQFISDLIDEMEKEFIAPLEEENGRRFITLINNLTK